MGKIRLLKEDVFRKIAAGEVIERPLSVVKELVENSIDAGATSIRVGVEKGGKYLIRIEDNGEGFSADDAERAFQPHSTSKLTEIEDLDRLQTLGFRGEALPSILEVAQITLKTSDNDEGRGLEIRFMDNIHAEKKEVAHPRGSSLEVCRLFFNLPVRRKFLRSDATELSQIVHFLEQAMLANPAVAFELVSNGRTLFQHPATVGLGERIFQLFGREFFASLGHVSFCRGGYSLEGFISLPNQGLGIKTRQFFVVNRRPVREKTLLAVVKNTCAPFQEKGKHPAAFLQLEVPPAEVDVNIHPMKLEIRFKESSAIYTFVKNGFESLLMSGREGAVVDETVEPWRSEAFGAAAHSRFQGSRVDPAPLFPSLTSPDKEAGFHILGQFSHSYIIVEREEELLIVDQHNAHERVLFDRLLQEYRRGEVSCAATLFPIVVELSHGAMSLLNDKRIPILKKAGFEVSLLGGTSVEIRTFPQAIEERRVKEIFLALLEMDEEIWMEEEKILAGIACKSAVKVNQRLELPEMQRIVQDLFISSNPYLCPHQRPISVIFSLMEIEKLLKRR